MILRGKDVAVKTFHARFDRQSLKLLKQEIMTMRAINSEYLQYFEVLPKCTFMIFRFVVNLVGVCTKPIAIIMEYVEGGSLSTLLRDDIELPWSIRLMMVGEIAQGIKALHLNVPQVFFYFHNYILK